MKVELTEIEIKRVIRGLNAQITDYCINYEEEKPYRELLEKFNKLIKREADKC